MHNLEKQSATRNPNDKLENKISGLVTSLNKFDFTHLIPYIWCKVSFRLYSRENVQIMKCVWFYLFLSKFQGQGDSLMIFFFSLLFIARN